MSGFESVFVYCNIYSAAVEFSQNEAGWHQWKTWIRCQKLCHPALCISFSHQQVRPLHWCPPWGSPNVTFWRQQHLLSADEVFQSDTFLPWAFSHPTTDPASLSPIHHSLVPASAICANICSEGPGQIRKVGVKLPSLSRQLLITAGTKKTCNGVQLFKTTTKNPQKNKQD